MEKKGKLELTWVGKYEEKKLEPRILIEDKSKSYGESNTENMLIHGDNLLALKALENKYTGMIKCIYIDPPYNTGAAFEHYDDNLEHSIWLGIMKRRLEILRNLLAEDGTIWIQIDDEEQAYLKVLCDEIFGRNNFVNMISVNMKNVAGVSGGGEDKKIKKNCEYVLVYARNYDLMPLFNGPYLFTEMSELVEQYRNNGKSWHYTSVLKEAGEKILFGTTIDGDGNEIKLYKRKGVVIKSVNQIMKEESLSEKEVYYKYGKYIFEAKDAQSSIRQRVIAPKKEYGIIDDVISIEYVPKTGKNRGKQYEQFYKGDKCRLFAWLRDISEEIDGVLYKKTLQGTYWDFTSNINNLTKEGGVEFGNGKKPEQLVSQIFEMSTQEGDLVLDSFLGSGTTAAVATKMRRKWIGIERGEQVYSHCKVRLDRVIDNADVGGISKEVGWQGGGGYKFYELAEPLLVKNKVLPIYQINPSYTWDMVCEAICKIEGFTYEPYGEFQGHSSENRFIHITEEFVNTKYAMSIMKNLGDKQSLLIYCKKNQADMILPENVEVKKIPKDLLDKCNFESEVQE